MGAYTVRLDFETKKEIGQEGRNSKVYLAHDKQLDGEIVIKEINKEKADSPDNYFKEARILHANQHNNIVRVNYACENDDNIYVAMPFYKNGSLKKKISDGNFLTIREAIRYSIQFLSGLNHIHSRGLIHFDIKPDNIMISDTNEALLSDFGLSLYVDSEGWAEQGMAYTLLVSPEQLASGFKQSNLTDIYQVGVTIYRMVNGNESLNEQLPRDKEGNWDGETFKKMILSGTFPNRYNYLPHVPKKLKTIINRCLNVNPASRFQNSLQLINALSEIDCNLDWRYSIDADKRIWERRNENSIHRITCMDNGDTSTIVTTKTINLHTTNCKQFCFTNISNDSVSVHLTNIFNGI